MIKCRFDFFKYIEEIIDNSGRGIFHRGHYQECLQLPHMKYSLIELGIGPTDTQAYVGMCLPKSCSDQFITTSIDSVLKIIGMPLNVYSIDSGTQNYQFPMNWMSYLTIIIIISLIGLVFIATIINYKTQNRSENKWLSCFDMMTNAKQHFKVRQKEDLNVWDGVRSIAMMWVVIGHSYSMLLGGGALNITNINDFGNKPFFLILEAGMFSVDIFFALGGFFLAFIMLRNKMTLKLCGLGIFQRALRIWPAYILAMLFYYSLFMNLGSGLLWSKGELPVQMCSTMWRQILFISNFIQNGSRSCLSWGWYLQVDFQLFIVGVLFLYLYSKKKWILWTAMSLFALFSTIFIYIYTLNNKVKILTDLSNNPGLQNFMLDVYIQPYGRCVPYLMGFALGIFFMEYRKIKTHPQAKLSFLTKVKLFIQQHNKSRIAIQWIGIGLMAFVTFVPRSIQTGHAWSQQQHSLYQALSKPIFIFGLFLAILPSALGIKHSFFNLILNAKVFVFVARISFCTYLVHVLVVWHYYYTRSNDFYYSILDIFIGYLGMLVLSLFFGTLLTLIVELPFSNLLKLSLESMKEKQALIVKKSESLLTSQHISEQQMKNREQV